MRLLTSAVVLYALGLLSAPAEAQSICPDGLLQDQCHGWPCNPKWFNWIGGCTSEVVTRTPKPVDIQSALDTVFHILPDSNTYSLDYVEQVMSKTEKIADKIYKFDFEKKGARPLLKDAIKAVEDVVSKMGMNTPNHDFFSWIRENILKFDSSEATDNSLAKVETFYKSIFTSLSETFTLNKKSPGIQYKLSSSSAHLESAIPNEEQILANLFVVDNDLEAMYQVWAGKNSGLDRNGYFTYQLLLHTAVLHINIKSLIALGSTDIQVQKDALKRSWDLHLKYKYLFNAYTEKAVQWRASFVGHVECWQGDDDQCAQTRCLRTKYYWRDDMRNVYKEESHWTMTQETQLYNLCTIYGENTNGQSMSEERGQYIDLLGEKMRSVYQTYLDHYDKITNGFYQLPNDRPVDIPEEDPFR